MRTRTCFQMSVNFCTVYKQNFPALKNAREPGEGGRACLSGLAQGAAVGHGYAANHVWLVWGPRRVVF